MDVLLVNPPTIRGASPLPYYQKLLAIDRHDGVSTLVGEHLGLQSLQASLLAAGHRAVVVNACLELHASVDETSEQIRRSSCGLVGFTGPLEVLHENVALARALRRSGFTGHITFGHDFATLNHERLLRLYPVLDSVVRGEGEVTLVELATALAAGAPLDSVAGLTFRRGYQIVANPPRPPVPDLDVLPWVSRFDLPKVQQVGMTPGLFTRRGCPYTCAYCTTGAVPTAEGMRGGERWRSRSAANVVDELQHLVEETGLRRFTFVDDLYLSKGASGARHALEIAEEILRRRLDIEYMIDCRVDAFDAEVFALLVRSGLRRVFVGVESGSQASLERLHKSYGSADIRAQLAIAADLGIDVLIGYIFFDPRSTLDDIAANHRLVVDLDDRDFTQFIEGVRVYAGTPLQRELSDAGLLRGAFPYYTPVYADPDVAYLHDRMVELAGLVLPALFERQAMLGVPKAVKEELFVLVADGMGRMIELSRQGDGAGRDAVYSAMADHCIELLSGSLAA